MGYERPEIDVILLDLFVRLIQQAYVKGMVSSRPGVPAFYMVAMLFARTTINHVHFPHL